jgi:hypothetical protein
MVYGLNLAPAPRSKAAEHDASKEVVQLLLEAKLKRNGPVLGAQKGGLAGPEMMVFMGQIV